jgi:hypothetical protein
MHSLLFQYQHCSIRDEYGRYAAKCETEPRRARTVVDKAMISGHIVTIIKFEKVEYSVVVGSYELLLRLCANTIHLCVKINRRKL